MNARPAVLVALVLVPSALLAACGGGDTPAPRVQQGLAAAVLGGSEKGIGPGAPSSGIPFREGLGGDLGSGGPSLQQGQTGITVQGYGSATADADSAVLELYFGSKVDGIEPLPVPETRGESGISGGAVAPSSPQSDQPSQPFTEADLQPVVDAIVAQGVAREDIEVIITSYDPYYTSATIRATVRNLDALQGIVDAATAAAAGLATAQLQSTNAYYTVADCASLERAAMQAAVEDARGRGAAFAEVLGVGLGAVTGAANYSYSPFGGAPCGSNYGGPYPLAGGVAYAQGQASQVQLVATVSITFAIQ